MYKKVANLSILLLLVFHFPAFSQNVDVDILKAFNKHGSHSKTVSSSCMLPVLHMLV